MKVLVCGTQYGASYIRALTGWPSASLTCVGVVSRGSQRSLQIAHQLGVAHYCDLAQISAEGCDLACVAVSGEAGKALVLTLLSKGIAVLCEHPVDRQFVQQALELANEKGTYFHVNAHFADLHAPQAFLRSVAVAEQQGLRCMHYALAVNLRTLYSALDMLGRALGKIDDLALVKGTSPEPRAFQSLMLERGSLSVSILCQNFSSAQDDGSATFLNHQCSAVFPHGTLILSETQGPLSWFPSSHTAPMGNWKTYMPIDAPAMNQQQLMQHRDHANLNAILSLAARIKGDSPPIYQHASYLLGLSQLWESVLNEFQPDANRKRGRAA